MQRAKKTFFAGARRIGKDELFADDDALLKGREVLFEPVDVPAPAESEAGKPAAKKTTARKPSGGAK